MANLILAVLLAAGAQKYEGRVQRFDERSGKIFLLMYDHSTGNWTLSPQAKVFAPNGTPAPHNAIRPGEQVIADVSQDGTVQTIRIQESDWGKAYGQIHRYDGRVIQIRKREQLEFEVQREVGTNKMMFTANKATRYLRVAASGPAQAGSIDDLKAGATVRCLLDARHQLTEVLMLE
jgi:hypothetical protein